MRELTRKQKSLLKKWYKEKEPTEKSKMLFGSINPISKVEDLTLEQYEELEKINDTEILYQNVNRFLNDLIFKD